MDVYSDWVDACDAVAKDTANQYDAQNPSQQRGISKQGIPEETGQGDGYDDDDYWSWDDGERRIKARYQQ